MMQELSQFDFNTVAHYYPNALVKIATKDGFTFEGDAKTGYERIYAHLQEQPDGAASVRCVLLSNALM